MTSGQTLFFVSGGCNPSN